jgi:deoxyadenosine/deoxycytidine kinase
MLDLYYIYLLYLILIGTFTFISIFINWQFSCINCQFGNLKKKYKIISLDGNIGAGKSTLLKILNDYIIQYNIKNISIVEEPVNVWESTGILKKFYENKNQNAGIFQLFVLETLVHAIQDKLNTLNNSNDTHIIITERSLDSTKWVFAQMLYDDGDISYEAMESYLYVYNKINKSYLPSATIYLNTSPEICNERIVKRNRDGEIISNEYLIKCDSYYKNMIKGIRNREHFNSKFSSVLEIDGNTNGDILCKQILNFIYLGLN